MNVIYTAITGDYDVLKPPPPIKGCHFIAFVDNPRKNIAKGWEKLQLIPFQSDPVRNSRRYKVTAHEMFPQAAYSLWIDGTVEIQTGFDLNALIEQCLAQHDLALFNHPKRNCIYDEAKACQERRLDNPLIINSQMAKYQSEKYPRNHGLVYSGIILRRHVPIVELLNTTWWKEICNGSRRDQLSFNYVLWKIGLTCATLPGRYSKNPFFKIHPHLRERSQFHPSSHDK